MMVNLGDLTHFPITKSHHTIPSQRSLRVFFHPGPGPSWPRSPEAAPLRFFRCRQCPAKHRERERERAWPCWDETPLWFIIWCKVNFHIIRTIYHCCKLVKPFDPVMFKIKIGIKSTFNASVPRETWIEFWQKRWMTMSCFCGNLLNVPRVLWDILVYLRLTLRRHQTWRAGRWTTWTRWFSHENLHVIGDFQPLLIDQNSTQRCLTTISNCIP